MSFRERIENLIGSGELRAALDQIVAAIPASCRELRNESIALSAELRRMEYLDYLGTEERDDLERRRRRLVLTTLALLDRWVETVSREELPVDEGDVVLVGGTPEKIFGANRLKGIAWLEKALQVARSVCRVVTPEGVGTGFLVGEDLILTNHHVVGSAEDVERCTAEFNYELDIDGRPRKVAQYSLVSRDFHTSQRLDYSIIRLRDGHPPLATWRFLSLEGDALPQIGDFLPIIQHPAGGPKQIALTGHQVVNRLDSRIQYLTNTLPGSSGSPIFNEEWRVVGIHCAGGSVLRNERGDKWFANEGILIRDILRDMPATVAEKLRSFA